MAKTWYGHYIYADLLKGQKFVDFKDYLELDKIIKNKNKKYRQLQARKMPPTMYGREVIIVPDSMANKIMIANKGFIDGSIKNE